MNINRIYCKIQRRLRKIRRQWQSLGRAVVPLMFWGVCGLMVPSILADDANTEIISQKKLSIIAIWPHDSSAYCQGLEYDFDKENRIDLLYESTGQYGKSQLRKTELKTGKVLQVFELASAFFGEGLVSVDNKIYQLTWQEGKCFVYDKATFKFLEDYRIRGEGWGLTFDGTYLIMSNGSANLIFLNPETVREKKRLSVYYLDEKGKKRPLKNINELEYIEGEIWANIYQTSHIARIDAETGKVLQFFDCSALVPSELRDSTDLVLNGIAWDKSGKRLFLTGKRWPVLYEMKVE